MKFSGLISEIMREVRVSSNEPFIIYRDEKNKWYCAFIGNRRDIGFDRVKYLNDNNSLYLEFKGADFSYGSSSFVYDKVLITWLHAECENYINDDVFNDFKSLVNFLEDNMSEFSQKVTDYIAHCDKPLSLINKIMGFSLTSDDPNEYYDMEKADKAKKIIKNIIRLARELKSLEQKNKRRKISWKYLH